MPGIARIRSSAGHGPEENHDETLSHMRSAAECVVETPRAHPESSRATRAGTCRRPLRTPQCRCVSVAYLRVIDTVTSAAAIEGAYAPREPVLITNEIEPQQEGKIMKERS